MADSVKVDYQRLFESLPGMYYVLTPGYIITAVSDVFLQETMTKREQLIGKFLFDIFPENPDENDANGESTMRASLRYVAEHKVAHTMAVLKYDIRTPDNVYRERYWSPLNQPVLNGKNELIFIIHQVRDVTDLMQAKHKAGNEKYKISDIATEHERELYERAQEIQKINNSLIEEVQERKIAQEKARASQALLQATIESHHDLLIFSIDTNYRYLVFNSAFKNSTFAAYGTTVVEGMSLLDSMTNAADREKAKAYLDRAFTGENFLCIEPYGDVNRFYFETRYTPVINAEGKIEGVTVQSANITDRILAEEQIRALNEELESFTYSVAHDLRAPLRAIDGYAAIMKQSYDDSLDEEAKRLLVVIMKNAKMMGQLIDDLLEFSRMGKLPLKIHSIDMDMLVRNILKEVFPSTQHRASITIDPLLPATGDRNLIAIVLTNLLSNGIKYSRNRTNSAVHISSSKTANEVIYSFKDNGVGFDMQYAAKLFGVFQRLHKASEFEGTGVGLAIVQRIIVKHGGRVWAESEIDKGSTFYFSLPLDK